MGVPYNGQIIIGFTPFHLAYEVKAILPIECEIPTLHSAIELLPKTTSLE